MLVLTIVLVLAVLYVSNSVRMSVFRGGPEAPPFYLFCATVLSSIKIYLIFLCAHTHTHTVADEDDEDGRR